VLAVKVTGWLACAGEGDAVKLVDSDIGPAEVKNSDMTGAPASFEVRV